jgi:beta-glucosidase
MTYDKNLRGFERVHLKPGETKRVSFTILPDFLALWNQERRRVVEPGEFQVMVGNASADIERDKKGAAKNPRQRGLWLSGTFEMVGQ